VHQGGQQFWPVTINAPSEEQICASSIAVAAEKVGGIIVIHHELVPFRATQERTDAIINI
jgi:hypothetical protein